MKQNKKLIILLLCMIMMLSCLSGCTYKQDANAANSTSGTNSFLVKNGESNYQILLPAEATKEEDLAAAEISYFFSVATGIDLTIVHETDEKAGNGKYISVGETKLYNSSKIKFDYEELGSSGFGLKTSGDDLYIVGYLNGVIFGAYDFLERQFGYSYYDDGVYTIEKNVTDKELLAFNVEFEPSIEYRFYSYGFQTNAKDPMYQYRMKLNNTFSRVGLAGGSWHNFLKGIPAETYYEQHPEWFTSKKDQLCLSRDRKGLATEMAEIIKQQILDADENGDPIEWLHIGQEDIGAWCSCESCMELMNRYGGYHVVTYILFMNELSDIITPWLEETNHDVVFTMFAYHETENAPVVYNESTGKYDLISEDLILRDNVKVIYAPINADYYSPFDEENNENTYANLQGWSQISDKLFIWIYSETFKNYMVPFDNFNSIKANYRLLEEAETFWCFNQGQTDNAESTGFSHLKAYLSVKLQWNADYDVNELIREYCNACYAEASDMIIDILNEYKLWRAYKYYDGTQDGNNHTVPMKLHWNAAIVQRGLAKFDEAFAAIEHYKTTDIDTYNRLYEAILLETISYRYIMIEFFPEKCGNDTELYEMKKEWKTDVSRLGIINYCELRPMSELYASWGI